MIWVGSWLSLTHSLLHIEEAAPAQVWYIYAPKKHGSGVKESPEERISASFLGIFRSKEICSLFGINQFVILIYFYFLIKEDIRLYIQVDCQLSVYSNVSLSYIRNAHLVWRTKN